MLRPFDRARLLGVALFALWVLGPIPLYFFTPVQQAVDAVLGWQVAHNTIDLVEPPLDNAPPDPVEPAPVLMADVPTPTPTSAGDLTLEKTVGPPPTPLALAAAVATPTPTDRQREGRYAFLLLGYGGAGHDGGYLTDSLMVVMVDPPNKRVTLLSLPRDAWVPMSFDDKTTFYGKVNSAYSTARDTGQFPHRLPKYRGERGAGLFASDTVSRIVGVPIAYYVALDFAGFRQMVDAIGGVEIDVPRAFGSSYPANDNPAIDPSWIWIQFRAGRQQMDGERAIRYARARNTDDASEGSDFARSRRQRLIIEAFQQRLMQPAGLLRIPQLLAIGGKHVDTNYDLPGATGLAEMLLDWHGLTFHQAALTSSNLLIESTGFEGAYVLVPRFPGRSWAAVQALVRRLWDDPTSVAVDDKSLLAFDPLPDPRAPTSAYGVVRFGAWLPPVAAAPVVADDDDEPSAQPARTPIVGGILPTHLTATPAPFGTAIAPGPRTPAAGPGRGVPAAVGPNATARPAGSLGAGAAQAAAQAGTPLPAPGVILPVAATPTRRPG